MPFLLFVWVRLLDVSKGGEEGDLKTMEKGSLITVRLKSMFISFQSVYFNGNHVFPLLIINDPKKQLLSLELLCNEAATLLISILIRL